MKVIPKSTFILLILLAFFLEGKSQDNALIKKVSITFEGISTQAALKQLEKKIGVFFTYTPSHIQHNNKVNESFSNQPLEYILTNITSEKATFKQVGNNIIIRIPTIKTKIPTEKKTIKGSVTNAETGATLENVTVFQVDKRQSTLSDKSSYSLTVKGKDGYAALSFNKKDFKDTIIIIPLDDIEQTNIQLHPLPIDTVPIDSLKVENIDLVNAVIKEDQKTQTQNIQNYTLHRFFQASLLPYVSTNKKMNAQSINNLSLNLFSGYSKGVNGVEIGGLVNINRDKMSGLQIAGFSNIVGGKTEGLQISGFANINLDTVQGIQASGFLNSTMGRLQGTQLSGGVNSALKDSKGFQASGYVNLAFNDYEGMQLSGFVNFVRHDLRGFQATATVNYARDVKGVQFAVVNKARDVKGIQLGLVNISNSTKGASIGLLNFIQEGYKSIDLTTGDVHSANLSFKTGTNSFYNILNFGTVTTSEKNVFTAGYGLGTRIPFAKDKWSFDWDNTLNFFLRTTNTPNGRLPNLLFNSDLFLSHVISDHISIRVAVTFHSYTRYDDLQITLIDSDITESEDSSFTEEWIGYKAGIAYVF